EKVIKYGEQQKIEHKIIVDGRQLKRIELTAKVNYDEVSNKILLIGSVQDITDRTGAAPPSAPPTTASSSNNSIRQHAISELSFNIRTPLSSITNLLNLFESTPLNQQQQDLLASLKTSFDDLSVVFNDLLNFSILFAEQVKIQEEDFNLKAFFETYRRSLHIRSEQIKVKSRLLSSDDLPEKVSSDSQKLMLLLNNVFNHAVKYSDEEDTITMEVHSKKSSQKITALFVSVSFKSRKTTRSSLKELMALASDSANDTQGVETIDTKRHVEKVIINKLIRAFGGTFSVLSGNQREIILQIELPVTVAAKEVVTSKVPEPSAPLRLLLVEDHPINRIATKRLLLSWSDQITVDVASNGEECLDKLKTSEYDLILMDIKMPKVSGIEATIKIRKKDSIPIIALTASASKSEEEKCLDVGMNDYLVKPFQPSDLYGCIMKLYQTI
ncbi:MAG: response regulator, partial [Bacteroidota bacterium]